jgi:2-polyprenyl-3-methyl-5-hydroxy-6-metoxy-1,4-benzoquinol methylase
VTDPTPYTSFAAEPDSTHNLVVSLVPPGARVLDVGCATGYMADVLKQRLGCTVVGIEISAAAGTLAAPFCERVIIGDVEALDLEQLLAGERFDCIIVADVLEHLRQPEVVLRRLAPLLAPDGAIVGSIPNVAHGAVRLTLLAGEFRYRDTGLLDNTHIRFFTRDTVSELMTSAGYVLTHLLRKRTDLLQTEIPVLPTSVPPELWQQLADDLEATTYQFVIRAVPVGATATAPLVTDSPSLVEQPALTILATLSEHEQTVRERDAWIANLQDEIAQKDERIASLQHELEEWRTWIEQIKAETATLDASRLAWIEEIRTDSQRQCERIATLESIDAERLGWIEQLKDEVASLEKIAAERRAWIAHLDAEIAARDENDGQRQIWIAQLQEEIRQLQEDGSTLRAKVASRDQTIARLRRETGQVDKLLVALRRRVTRLLTSRAKSATGAKPANRG